MNAIIKTTTLAQSLADTAWNELGFPGMIEDDYDPMDVANYIDTASDCYEYDTGVAVELHTIMEARAILSKMSDAELERREQEEISKHPNAVQMSVKGVVSWYIPGSDAWWTATLG